MATWVVVESELDAMSVHHACGGAVGVLSVLTVSGKPDVTAHRHLLSAVRILLALDVDKDKDDGSNPGAKAWPWWEGTYSQARLWPVPEGKDPGEAFALGVNLREWVSAGMPVGGGFPSSGTDVNTGAAGAVSERGQVGKVDEVEAVENTGNGVFVGINPQRGWRVPRVTSLREVVFPPDIARFVTPRQLISAFRTSRNRAEDEYLIPCPKAENPFWWQSVKNCVGCSGHRLCLVGLVQSQIFQEALHAH
jgi:hypothetical protein